MLRTAWTLSYDFNWDSLMALPNEMSKSYSDYVHYSYVFLGIEYLQLCYSSIFLGSFRNYFLFVFSDDTMELPFDSRENEYWLFFLTQSSSMKMRWPLDITRKYFNCLNFRNLIGGAAAGALSYWNRLISVSPLEVIHLFFFSQFSSENCYDDILYV